MTSASTQEKIDEPTRNFLRPLGNAVNALLVKLPAQGIPEQVNTRYCLSEVHQRSLRRLGPARFMACLNSPLLLPVFAASSRFLSWLRPRFVCAMLSPSPKTAKALGLTISESFLFRADQLIE